MPSFTSGDIVTTAISDNRDDIRNFVDEDTAEHPFVIVPDEEEGERLVERPPAIPTPTIGQGLKNLRNRARNIRDRTKKTSTAVRKPRTAPRPRVAVDRLISHAWTVLARVVAPVSMPVARVLELQAPVAGLVLEDVVKGTVVDRVLQPLARIEGGGETAFAMIGPPLLVGMLQNRPNMAPVLVPILREALRTWIIVAGPKLERVAEQEIKFQEQYGARIDQLIEYILQDVKSPDDNSSGAHSAE